MSQFIFENHDDPTHPLYLPTVDGKIKSAVDPIAARLNAARTASTQPRQRRPAARQPRPAAAPPHQPQPAAPQLPPGTNTHFVDAVRVTTSFTALLNVVNIMLPSMSVTGRPMNKKTRVLMLYQVMRQVYATNPPVWIHHQNMNLTLKRLLMQVTGLEMTSAGANTYLATARSYYND